MVAEESPFGPDALRDVTPDELRELNRCFELSVEAWRKAYELLSLERAGATLQFKKALDSKILSIDAWQWGTVSLTQDGRKFDVDYTEQERSQVAQIAHRLAERHNAQLIGEQFVHAVRLAASGDAATRTQGLHELGQLRTWAAKNGFFLEEYDDKKMSHRVRGKYLWKDDLSRTPSYLIVETSGRHPDPAHRFHRRAVPAADCQIALPMPSEKATHVVGVPETGDECIDEGLAEFIRAHPSAVASVDDIVCIPDMNGLRLAAQALDRALAELTYHANTGRRAHPIRYVAASIATLRGIMLDGDVALQLSEDLQAAVIPNGRSHHLFDTFSSPHCGAFMHAYTLRNRRIPVAVRHADGSVQQVDILVDWSVRVAPVNLPSAEAVKTAGA